MKKNVLLLALLLLALIISGCASMAVSAEEYYSLGMAYFDLGKYEEAEKWLTRAKQADRTMVASQYNLGRLAFERQRYQEAAKHFEDVLKRDPDNILALRAAAYSRIKTGEIDIADKHYHRLLRLVPESADDGYNHALVLYAMRRYSDAETVLEKYPVALEGNKDMQLLFARCQGAQKKVEAIDTYANWLEHNKEPKARFDYAQLLEYHEFYARALEEYRLTMIEVVEASGATSGASSGDAIQANEIHLAIARVLLIADGENSEGLTELQTAVNESVDIAKVEELLNEDKISNANKESIRKIIESFHAAAVQPEHEESSMDDSGSVPDFYDAPLEAYSEAGSD
ncbi:MAG: tetratricopeptide repeat protein [Treponema sp.]|jgi:tetratricopeptide (TPR) repeat protein|nr:tetratricopeptide repeat protein [Treponema sp.]